MSVRIDLQIDGAQVTGAWSRDIAVSHLYTARTFTTKQIARSHNSMQNRI